MKIRVFLKWGYSSIHKSLILKTPSNIRYVLSSAPIIPPPHRKLISLRSKIWINSQYVTRKPFLSKPQIKEPVHLVHSCCGALLKTSLPWLVDFDHPLAFASYDPILFYKFRREIEKVLSKNNCKKLVALSENAKKALFNYVENSEIKEKCEVINPPVDFFYKKKKFQKSTLRLIFISTLFYEKGGLEVLKSFEHVKKKYDVELIFICNTPLVFRQKYKKDVIFLKPIFSRDSIIKFLNSSDVFIFPTYCDTFGMSLLEAIATSTPVITTNAGIATQEIVDNCGIILNALQYSFYNKNLLPRFLKYSYFRDFLIKCEKENFINQLKESISVLIEDTSLRKKFSKNCRKNIMKRFHFKLVNKKLKEIYEEVRGR
jgi:glycosyltransferase involved in cell wall biosynthesis